MTATDVRQLGSEAARTKLVDALSKFKGIYVTIDIDCIDPSEVKGTGTPLPGGLPTTFVLELVRSLKPLNIIGFELTELAPELDPTGFSNIVAVDILWHFLSFGFSAIKSPKLSLQGIVR
jgi:arginase family enzyme